MSNPDQSTYLSEITSVLRQHWPANRTINIVCHGHSVPAGYFATPMVDSMNAYPHLLQAGLKHRFPFAVVNVIVTAIGGENSESGAARFERDVLGHRPDVITIDYALNDRGLGLKKAGIAWRHMVAKALNAGIKVILLTPTADLTQDRSYRKADRNLLPRHAAQIASIARDSGVALVDSLAAFQPHIKSGHLTDLLSWGNHPNRAGHELVARELLRWFPAA